MLIQSLDYSVTLLDTDSCFFQTKPSKFYIRAEEMISEK
jgi:hypothetical protein